MSRRWLGLGFIALAQLMIALDATIVSIALPSAQAALHASDQGRSWVVAAYTLAFGLLLLPGGRLADQLGRRRAFLIGLSGFALASLLGGVAPAFPVLIASRALQGAFAALLAPTALSLLAVTFTDPKERATAFAVWGSIAGSGAAIGMLLGGALTQYLSWRWCLLVNLPIAVVSAAGSLAVVKNEPGHGRGLLDLPDLARTTIRVVADHSRAATYATVALAIAGMLGAYLLLTYHLQAGLHFTPLQAGLGFLPITVASQSGSWLIARRLATRLGAGTQMGLGALVAAAGLGWLSLAPSGYATSVLPAEVLLGLGISTAMTRAFSSATLGVDRRDAGVASAAINSAQQIGGSAGAALLNALATLQGIPAAAGWGALLLALAAIVAAAGRRFRLDSPPAPLRGGDL